MKKRETIGDRIIKYLEETAPTLSNPTTISNALNIKNNIIRATLHKLLKGNKVVRQHGFYRALYEPEHLREELNNVRLHHIKIEAKATYKDSSVLAATFRRAATRRIWSLIFRGRGVTITQHDMGLVEIFPKLGKSEKAFSFWDFDAFISWLDGITYHNPLQRCMLRTLDINCDLRRLNLHGLSEISLKGFRNAWARLYIKDPYQTRLEWCMTTEIGLKEALDILKFMVEPRVESKQIDHDQYYIK